MIFLLLFSVFAVQAFGKPQVVRFDSNDPRETDEARFRTFERRRPGSGSSSNIEDAFNIPIAVIQGTSLAAQALSPQNSQVIQSVFNIPVSTLNAVGNYIKDTQRPGIGINNDNDRIGTQRPLSLSEQRRRERRERLEKLKEEERERRRKMQEEKFFLHGHSGLNFLSGLADILLGTNGHSSHFSGSHGHGHQWKPPKRPLKPGHRPGHIGSSGSFPAGNYEVYEQTNEEPVETSGILSWFQTGPSQFADEKIENKIAPRSL